MEEKNMPEENADGLDLDKLILIDAKLLELSQMIRNINKTLRKDKW